MVSENKIKILLVCEEDLPRTLTTIELHNHKDFDFVGSCKFDSTMKRFLIIYKPQIVLVYAYGKKKKNYYKCVRYLRNNSTSRIVVLVPNITDYDVNLFLRYGAHSITDGSCDIFQLLKETSYQLAATKYPSEVLYMVPLKKDGHINKEKRGSVDTYLAYDSIFVRRRVYAGGINTRQAKTPLFLSRKEDANKYVLQLKSTRELPENADDLVDYCCLFPETFCELVTNGVKEEPKRFLFVITSEKIHKVEKLRNKKREKHKSGEVNYKGYKYDFEMSEKFRVNYDK